MTQPRPTDVVLAGAQVGQKVLQDITFRGNKNQLPEYARKKLSELEADSKAKSNYIPTFKPKQNKEQRKIPITMRR